MTTTRGHTTLKEGLRMTTLTRGFGAVAGVLPALRAARFQPVETLRSQ